MHPCCPTANTRQVACAKACTPVLSVLISSNMHCRLCWSSIHSLPPGLPRCSHSPNLPPLPRQSRKENLYEQHQRKSPASSGHPGSSTKSVLHSLQTDQLKLAKILLPTARLSPHRLLVQLSKWLPKSRLRLLLRVSARPAKHYPRQSRVRLSKSLLKIDFRPLLKVSARPVKATHANRASNCRSRSEIQTPAFAEGSARPAKHYPRQSRVRLSKSLLKFRLRPLLKVSARPAETLPTPIARPIVEVVAEIQTPAFAEGERETRETLPTPIARPIVEVVAEIQTPALLRVSARPVKHYPRQSRVRLSKSLLKSRLQLLLKAGARRRTKKRLN